jgi:hypothetical protein
MVEGGRHARIRPYSFRARAWSALAVAAAIMTLISGTESAVNLARPSEPVVVVVPGRPLPDALALSDAFRRAADAVHRFSETVRMAVTS